MAKTPKNTPLEIEAPASTLTLPEIHRAAFNLPADQFALGDRLFQLQDLSYDNYLLFLGYLTPLIEVVVQRAAGSAGVSIPGIDLQSNALSANNILKLCGKELPEMVQIMCRESAPDITVEEVKALAKRPTVLVTAVIKQIKQNGMIQDFADFFGQVLSVVKPLTPDLNQST